MSSLLTLSECAVRRLPLYATVALAGYLESRIHNPTAGVAVSLGLLFGWAGLMAPVFGLGHPNRRNLAAVMGCVVYAMSIYVGLAH